MARQFSILPGKREALPLFIGLVGPSSSGKTRSAFELAVGIQSVVGGEIVFINTEGRRGLVDIDLFKKPDGSPAIQHMPFSAPYASLDYLAAIQQAQASGAKTIVIDSMTHEHDAEGGMLDYQDRELQRLAGDSYGTRQAEKWNMLAWQQPKAARRKLLTRGIMQADVNIIACFRAKETSKPIKVPFEKNGQTFHKTEVVSMGFTPIAGDEFVFEMSLSAFLPPNSRGVPNWNPDNPGERMAVKRNAKLEKIVPDGQQLSQKIGAALATWARGESTAKTETPDADPIAGYGRELAAKLKSASFTELSEWWSETAERRDALNIPADRLEKMNAAVAKALEG